MREMIGTVDVKMNLKNIAVFGVFLIVLAACDQKSPAVASKTPEPSPVVQTPGPCVDGLCLGTESPQDLTQCSPNISTTNLVDIRLCPLPKPIAIAGVPAVSGEVTLIDKQLARARLVFESTACGLIQSSLEENLGQNELDRTKLQHGAFFGFYRKYGDDSGGDLEDLQAAEWKTPKGIFALSRWGIFNWKGGCVLRVESYKGPEYLKNVVKKGAENSVSG